MLLFSLALASTADAPRDALVYDNTTIGRLNPMGGMNRTRLGWRHRLSESDHVLLADTHTFFGGSAVVTPAYSRLGLYGEVQPLAVLKLFGELNRVGYYGTFRQVQTFDAEDAYSDDILGEGKGRSMAGWTGMAGGTIRGKIGPVAVRSTFQGQRIDLEGLGPDAFFYDQVTDRLVQNGGWVLSNDADLLLMHGPWVVGARHSWTAGLDNPAGTDGSLAHHRIGPLVAYEVPGATVGSGFTHPTVFVMSQWWVQHPYRTGATSPGGMPMVVAGFSFKGALFSREHPSRPHPAMPPSSPGYTPGSDRR